jgi:hypothetical protein
MKAPGDVVKRAVDAVKEAGLDPDSDLGIAMSREVFRELVREAPAGGEAAATQGTQMSPGATDAEARLARWLDVPGERVRDVIALNPEGADLHIHSRSLPPSKRARQRLLGLLKLAIDRVAYERQEVPATEINAICERYAALDQNLPFALTHWKDYITRRGSRGAYTYRISQPGVDEARDVLLALLNAA